MKRRESHSGVGEMLPAFPKIEAARSRINRQIIEQLTAQLSPILREIDRHIQFEGRETTIFRYDDTVGHSALDPVSAEVVVHRIPLEKFTNEELFAKLKHIAEQMAKGISANFYAEMERATTEVGNVVDGQGQPLSEELILKAIEKIEHTFEPDGSWNPPTLLVHPDVFNQLMRSANARGSDSSGFDRSLKKILDEKRDDFRRREADRILAG
jgi:hypothetical protein